MPDRDFSGEPEPTEYLGRAGRDGRTEYLGRAGEPEPTEYLGRPGDVGRTEHVGRSSGDEYSTRYDLGPAADPRRPAPDSRPRQVIPPPGQRSGYAEGAPAGYSETGAQSHYSEKDAEDYDVDRRSGRLGRYQEPRRGMGGGAIAILVLAVLALGGVLFLIGRLSSGGSEEPTVETTTEQITQTQVTTVTTEPERTLPDPRELLSELPSELPSIDTSNLPELPSLPEGAPISEEDARAWWQGLADKLSELSGRQQ